jgi:murein DD-endopeptidase MepM/ murein hydrolase activator NlpD
MIVVAGQRMGVREELHQPLVVAPSRLAGDPQPTARGPRPPILPVKVTPHGAFRQVRRGPADGACGTKGYPCIHPGVDLYGPAGTEVFAPEDGVVVAVANGSSSPWKGYGPWLIVIRGASGVYHLLAHLSPERASLALVGSRVVAGQLVGVTSSANHTHWEVRIKAIPDFAAGESNQTNNLDPFAWLARQRRGAGGGWLLAAAAAAAVYVLLG